jgi:hypothetical protein
LQLVELLGPRLTVVHAGLDELDELGEPDAPSQHNSNGGHGNGKGSQLAEPLGNDIPLSFPVWRSLQKIRQPTASPRSPFRCHPSYPTKPR